MWWRRRSEVTLLVLCTANVCRSPAAAALLRAQLRWLGLGRRVRVLSAGTDAVPGMAPDPRMRALSGDAGAPLRSHRSMPLTAGLLADATVVYGMEARHLDAAQALLPGPAAQQRTLFLPGEVPVPDPFFGSMADVRDAFEALAEGAAWRAREWRARLD